MDSSTPRALLLRLLARTDQRIAGVQERLFHVLSAEETHSTIDSITSLQNLRFKIEAELDLERLKRIRGYWRLCSPAA